MKILTAINESIAQKANKRLLQKHYISHYLTQQKYITKIVFYCFNVLYEIILFTRRRFSYCSSREYS